MKNNDLKNENEIKTIQFNPKFRLFLLIFCNWFFSTFLFWFIPCAALIPYLVEHFYISLIIFSCFVLFIVLYRYYIMHTGIKYLLTDLLKDYLRKNNKYLQKIDNTTITDISQFFNVTPICQELNTKKQIFKTRTEEEFIELSWIEACCNRLVINGKINNFDFSWGVVTKIKKSNFQVFLFAILYFGPIFGTFWGLFPQKMVNEDFYRLKKFNKYVDPLSFLIVFIDMFTWAFAPDIDTTSPKLFKYKKMGVLDLFPSKVEKLNSENYLIFSAKLKNQSDVMTLIPKSNNEQFNNLDDQYEWPVNFSETQKIELKSLIKEMSFLPSIYLYNDNISIVMKKYHYNPQDNQELQTWELIKNEESNNEVQFNYLNQAVKIYQIFN